VGQVIFCSNRIVSVQHPVPISESSTGAEGSWAIPLWRVGQLGLCTYLELERLSLGRDGDVAGLENRPTERAL
jgi:hypothetical protein